MSDAADGNPAKPSPGKSTPESSNTFGRLGPDVPLSETPEKRDPGASSAPTSKKNKKDEAPGKPDSNAKERVEEEGNPGKKTQSDPEDAGPPRDVEEPKRFAYVASDKIIGGGVVNGPLNITLQGEQKTAAPTFEDDLLLINDPPRPRTDIADEAIDKYSNVLLDHRLVVISHTPGGAADALSSMLSVVYNIRQRDPVKQFATSGFDRLFPLHSFYEVSEWKNKLRGAVIYLNRSSDVAATTFFADPNKRGFLKQRLEEVDVRLIATVAVERTASRSYFNDDPGNWIIRTPEAVVPPEVSTRYSEPFEAAAVATAALFPGLGAQEFAALVHMLTPDRALRNQVPQAPANPDGNKTNVPAPVTRTREERWLEGEHDTVLAELGVAFRTITDEPSSGSGFAPGGLVLEDETQRAEMPGWVLRRFPLLLTQHLDELAARYFSAEASNRFRMGFLNLLARLEAHGFWQMEPEWLLPRFLASVTEDRAEDCARHLSTLLARSLDGRNGDRLVEKVTDRLVDALLHEEQKLFLSIPPEHLASAFESATDPSSEEDPMETFWSDLLKLQGSPTSVFAAAIGLLLPVVNLLVELSRYRPALVRAAVQRLFAEDALRGTTWPQLKWPPPYSSTHARFSRLGFQGILSNRILQQPSHWAAFAETMAGESSGEPGKAAPTAKTSRAMRVTNSDEDEKRARLILSFLAMDCVIALDRLLTHFDPGPLPEAVYEALLAEGQRSRTGRLLADLIRGCDGFGAGFIVVFYRTLTTSLLSRKDAVESSVFAAMFELISPLRTQLAGSKRLEIARTAREHQERFAARRDYFRLAKQEEPLRTAVRRIAAMRIVIRAWSGISPTRNREQPSSAAASS